MSKIIMTKGLPASGKTTWAKLEVAKSKGKIKRVNKDDLRAMVDAGTYSKDRENHILEIRDELITKWLGDGKDVIVDDTNLNPIHEQALRLIAEELGAEFEVKDFTDVDVDECIERDLKRPNTVGKKVILEMYNRFFKKPKQEEDPKLPYTFLCDVDGTLALHNGRSPFKEDEVDKDSPNIAVCRVVETLINSGYHVSFVSGRHDTIQCRGLTMKWLHENIKKPEDCVFQLLMRGVTDNRPDYEVKKEIYNTHIKPFYNVLGVFDDREQVVKMWRKLGITVFQVDEGRF